MNRAVHATTPSGDEVTLEANAQLTARDRSVAQVEHNAMLALDLVRAALVALDEVCGPLERAGLLLSHSPVLLDSAVEPELRRVIEQLGIRISGALLDDDPLLSGGGATFALQDARDETAQPVRVELPDLRDAYRALVAIELGATIRAQPLSQAHAALVDSVHGARKQLLVQASRLSDVLRNQRRRPAKSSPRRAEDEGFVAMIQQVRNSVLHAGDAALLVQGSPSSRAAWLVEALDRAT